jgi:hypothetical protein
MSKSLRQGDRDGRDGCDSPLSVEVHDWPGDEPGEVARCIQYQKGIVTLSDYHWVGGSLLQHSVAAKHQSPSISLQWEGMSELGSDDGLQDIIGILMKHDLCLIGSSRRECLLADIKSKVDEDNWERVLTRIGLGPKGDSFIVALWAELHLDALSDPWLAAVGQHAYFEGDYFAFGYVSAQLNMRKASEDHFLRGRKIVESAKLGAELRAKRREVTTNRTLGEMARLVEAGRTLSEAAKIAHRGKFGTSPDANRKLWERHRRVAPDDEGNSVGV